MAFYWSLSDNKSPQVTRILLSILADLHNAVVWMVSTRPLISKSSSPCIIPFVIVPRAPTAIDINVTFTFHSFFFNSLARSRCLALFSLSFSFYSVVKRNSKIHHSTSIHFFFLIIIRSGRLGEIRRSICIIKIIEGVSPWCNA